MTVSRPKEKEYVDDIEPYALVQQKKADLHLELRFLFALELSRRSGRFIAGQSSSPGLTGYFKTPIPAGNPPFFSSQF